MARHKKMTKAESNAIGFLIVIGAVIAGIVAFFQAVGFIIPGIILVLGVSIYLWNKNRKEKEEIARINLEKERRLLYLQEKYQDQNLIARILDRQIWQGQTSEQLRDTLGLPLDIDSNVLKTKVREVWKYRNIGKNRFGLRIKLENDVVVGWEEKA